MRRSLLSVALLLPAIGCAHNTTNESAARDDQSWQRRFDVPHDRFASAGRSPYFILEPGHQMTYEGKEDGEPHRLIITVLPETETVDGVETRVVEEREWAAGQLEEVSRNYFAIDTATKDVYYFGEDVDTYKNGKVTGHEGGWQSGVNGAHYGLAIPASPRVGQRYYQEIAPHAAMDRAEIVSTRLTKKVPAGEFTHCVRTEETSPLEPGTKEYKVYAPDVGLIIDGGLQLVRQGHAAGAPDSH